jgi:hypothetical protein
MDGFSWVPVRPSSRRFPSPCFIELTPAASPRSAGGGESPLLAAAPFDRAVLSWNGTGRWRLEMRLEIGGVLTPYFVLGGIDGARHRSASAAERPEAPAGPVALEVDTLVLRGGEKATGFQVRATGEGGLSSLGIAHYRRDQNRYTDTPAVGGAWGRVLPVPERAQRDVEDEPGIAGDVCSATSVGMVLEFHGSRHRTIDLARAAFDPEARLYGNWPCNTATAARLLKGGWAAVAKLTGFHEVEREITARRPVILSHRWERGDLSGAPVSRSNGHLVVVAGFTREGDVVVNDPAAKAGAIRRVYRRRELFRTWQSRGEGIAYLVHPARKGRG